MDQILLGSQQRMVKRMLGLPDVCENEIASNRTDNCKSLRRTIIVSPVNLGHTETPDDCNS